MFLAPNHHLLDGSGLLGLLSGQQPDLREPDEVLSMPGTGGGMQRLYSEEVDELGLLPVPIQDMNV